jgi:hypothetical protein
MVPTMLPKVDWAQRFAGRYASMHAIVSTPNAVLLLVCKLIDENSLLGPSGHTSPLFLDPCYSLFTDLNEEGGRIERSEDYARGSQRKA